MCAHVCPPADTAATFTNTSLQAMTRAMSIQLTGRLHSGLDDSLTIASVLMRCLGLDTDANGAADTFDAPYSYHGGGSAQPQPRNNHRGSGGSSPYNLELLGMAEGGRSVEAEAHRERHRAAFPQPRDFHAELAAFVERGSRAVLLEGTPYVLDEGLVREWVEGNAVAWEHVESVHQLMFPGSVRSVGKAVFLFREARHAEAVLRNDMVPIGDRAPCVVPLVNPEASLDFECRKYRTPLSGTFDLEPLPAALEAWRGAAVGTKVLVTNPGYTAIDDVSRWCTANACPVPIAVQAVREGGVTASRLVLHFATHGDAARMVEAGRGAEVRFFGDTYVSHISHLDSALEERIERVARLAPLPPSAAVRVDQRLVGKIIKYGRIRDVAKMHSTYVQYPDRDGEPEFVIRGWDSHGIDSVRQQLLEEERKQLQHQQQHQQHGGGGGGGSGGRGRGRGGGGGGGRGRGGRGRGGGGGGGGGGMGYGGGGYAGGGVGGVWYVGGW